MYVPLAAKGILFLTFAVIANSEDLVLDDENFVDMMEEQNIANKIDGLDFFNEMVLGSKRFHIIFFYTSYTMFKWEYFEPPQAFFSPTQNWFKTGSKMSCEASTY